MQTDSWMLERIAIVAHWNVDNDNDNEEKVFLAILSPIRQI